jgi:hydrogenase nickel incorporation protein HypA/HybF
VHELALMDDLVTTITSELVRQSPRANSTPRVTIVRIEVGRKSCASPHALLFSFEVCAKDTPLEGAKLEITERDGAELRLQEIEVIDVHDMRL